MHIATISSGSSIEILCLVTQSALALSMDKEIKHEMPSGYAFDRKLHFDFLRMDVKRKRITSSLSVCWCATAFCRHRAYPLTLNPSPQLINFFFFADLVQDVVKCWVTWSPLAESCGCAFRRRESGSQSRRQRKPLKSWRSVKRCLLTSEQTKRLSTSEISRRSLQKKGLNGNRHFIRPHATFGSSKSEEKA